jgi:hypothetical protein
VNPKSPHNLEARKPDGPIPTQFQPSGSGAPRSKTSCSLRSMSPCPVVMVTASCCDAADNGVVLQAACDSTR